MKYQKYKNYYWRIVGNRTFARVEVKKCFSRTVIKKITKVGADHKDMARRLIKYLSTK